MQPTIASGTLALKLADSTRGSSPLPMMNVPPRLRRVRGERGGGQERAESRAESPPPPAGQPGGASRVRSIHAEFLA
ncbi:MAG: hypothetical protein WDN49_01805 [Acetobacteraceae bacterium]